jgi:hypothetical protein
LEQTARPLDEGEFVGKAAFKQYTNREVARQISGREQGSVLSDTEVKYLIRLCKNE